MKLKDILQNKWFKIFSNIYVMITTFFIIWMLFFDTNNWYTMHRGLNKEIEKLRDQQEHLRKEIAKDKELIKELKSKPTLEKFAREKYYYKRNNEEIYLIEFDSIKDE